ncbi:unnamed protein product [Ilex paraguariensis]|uniref:RNA helicase aquarius N-terminal domain-containing protein n=1 Tax=Ilex paraguariensis TaxID=185542 RepID=A0ABC8R0H2_9AQUA
MTKVYGTGVYDFKRHRVAEYPVDVVPQRQLPISDKPPESKPGSNLPSSITLSEIQRDRLTKIAEANWVKTGGDSGPKKPFSHQLVKEIYETELVVKGGRKPVPLQRVMILEVSQYLENYLWPNFDPEAATFEHVMSMILMVNEKFRENVAAWICFYDRKDMFKAFLERVLCLKEHPIPTSLAQAQQLPTSLVQAYSEFFRLIWCFSPLISVSLCCCNQAARDIVYFPGEILIQSSVISAALEAYLTIDIQTGGENPH